MDEAAKKLVARMRECTGKKVCRNLFVEAADTLEKLCTELAIKESVQGALENTIRDERAENSLKMAEIKRLRDGLEKILQTECDQHYDIANFALEKIHE